ncbi:MAG: TlpA family protein disulfide reductase [Solirubrobacterales bacterium]
MRDRYSIAVGVAFAVVVVLAIVHQTGQGTGTLGLDRLPKHWPLPEFAVPLASGTLEGDANVAQDDCASSRLPCSDPRTPACGVDEPGAFRVCELFAKPSLISFWFTKGDGCVEQQDVVNRAFERYRGRVAFLSLDVHDDPVTVRDLARERGWRMPVGYDRDGAVAALYRVGGCPTFAYVFPGGTLQSASIGDLTEEQLATRIEDLLRATRAAEGGGRS